MKSNVLLLGMVSLVVLGVVSVNLLPVQAGETPFASNYKVLEPIRHGNLTVFPVIAPKSYATGEFLTLDEGLRSGDVVVTEYGNIRGLMRRRPVPAVQRQNAEVNRLVLINNSKRPLLLAGEIVTGGSRIVSSGKTESFRQKAIPSISVCSALSRDGGSQPAIISARRDRCMER